MPVASAPDRATKAIPLRGFIQGATAAAAHAIAGAAIVIAEGILTDAAAVILALLALAVLLQTKVKVEEPRWSPWRPPSG